MDYFRTLKYLKNIIQQLPDVTQQMLLLYISFLLLVTFCLPVFAQNFKYDWPALLLVSTPQIQPTTDQNHLGKIYLCRTCTDTVSIDSAP